MVIKDKKRLLTTGMSISSLDDDDDECTRLRLRAILVFFLIGDVSEFDDDGNERFEWFKDIIKINIKMA